MRRRKRMLEELDQDIHDHIERETHDNIERGMSPEEARYAALRKFGNVTRVKEETREVWSFVWLEQLLQDMRYGARMLRTSSGFTTVAVLTLALGIGANTAIFSVIDGVLLTPLPYEQPQQLVAMDQNDSLMNVIDIQRQARAFTQGGGINTEAMDYTGGTEPVQVHAAYVNAGFLETLGVPPMFGRIISPEEDVQGGPRVAVVSYHFWRNYMNSDPRALGKTIPLSANSYAVIGVMPESFSPPREHADVFVSFWVAYPEAAPVRGVHFMHAYWRLKPGATLTQAQAEMAAIDRQLAEQYPASEKGRKTQLVPLHQWLTGDVRAAFLVLFGAVGLVLLIACANFAGLLMARAAVRRQELVIRAALGAGRSRLVRQALTESVLLSLIGGVAGLLLAKWGTSVLVSLKPAALERFSGIQMDARVLMFVFGVSILTGVVFGFASAWSAARAEVAEALKESGRSTTASAAGHRIRTILVTAELALALVLLVGAGLLIKGFSLLRSVNPGFNPSNVLTMSLQLPATRYARIPPQTQFRREVLTRLNSLPGVQAAMISDIPLGGGFVSHTIVIAGRPPVAVGDEAVVQTLSVMGNYLGVMQIPIREGRDFTAMDREGQPLVGNCERGNGEGVFPARKPDRRADRLGKNRRTAPMDGDHRSSGQHQTFRIKTTDGSRGVRSLLAVRRSLETVDDGCHPNAGLVRRGG
jgi:putative ABC transport system permease protein